MYMAFLKYNYFRYLFSILRKISSCIALLIADNGVAKFKVILVILNFPASGIPRLPDGRAGILS